MKETSLQIAVSPTVFPSVMRAKDAARYLGIGTSTFWAWVKDRRLPQGTHFSARCTVWKKEALDQFIARQFGDGE